MHDLFRILWISTIAGLATTFGSLLVLVFGKPQERVLASLIAGAGGVMLAVVTLDLLPSAWQTGQPLQAVLGFGLGLLFMFQASKRLHVPNSGLPLSRRQRLKRTGLLIATGIALHDIPEGMAIAVSQEAAPSLGLLIAFAIALHNLPEGMATTAPLKMASLRWWKILLLNIGIAVFTPLGALLGLLALENIRNSLALFLALAAGAMSFLVFAELIPLSRERHPHYALLGGTIGFMLFALINMVHI